MIDLDQLAADRAEHQARADDAAARLAEHQAADAADAAAQLDTYDREVIANYRSREAELLAQEHQARAEFRAAVLADPMIAAWIRARSLRWERTALRADVANAITRTGSDVRPPVELRYAAPRLWDDILQVAEDTARATAGDGA
jgi:hypothetical protein